MLTINTDEIITFHAIVTYTNKRYLAKAYHLKECKEQEMIRLRIEENRIHEVLECIEEGCSFDFVLAELTRLLVDGMCGDKSYIATLHICGDYTRLCAALKVNFDDTRNGKLHFIPKDRDQLEETVCELWGIGSKVRNSDMPKKSSKRKQVAFTNSNFNWDMSIAA
jgi:hypothetical protein